jgi:hypothetical protein
MSISESVKTKIDGIIRGRIRLPVPVIERNGHPLAIKPQLRVLKETWTPVGFREARQTDSVKDLQQDIFAGDDR